MSVKEQSWRRVLWFTAKLECRTLLCQLSPFMLMECPKRIKILNKIYRLLLQHEWTLCASELLLQNGPSC